MNRNDRFMIEETGEILDPKVAEFFIDEDLYTVYYGANASGFRETLDVVEVWANETEFLGYIVKRPNAEVISSWITEFIKKHNEGNAHQSARGASRLPLVLNKS